ncbi:hypothetical protein N7456_001634 [Penicillium angulare]|uniref:BTB domain-containing protein n=1 Tax=Penicillium angulare TaxID=116970 RepID=A0A9W9KP15_9EURO|nr:hypothetical protein N7456_001634 [Penicillium angulare]
MCTADFTWPNDYSNPDHVKSQKSFHSPSMATGDILKRKHAIAFPPDSDTIDNDGDVFIVVEGQGEVATRRFLVSSKVLSLASPVFEKLFGPNFKEGKELANKTRPDIELHDDDAEAMSTLFNVLHFRETGEVLKMDIKRLAKVAIHCDKYDCARALTPWIPYWFNQLEALPTGSESDEPQPTVEETGLLLLAAHFFRALTIFSDHFAQAQKILPPGFELEWAKTLDLRLMSDEITCRYSFRYDLF